MDDPRTSEGEKSHGLCWICVASFDGGSEQVNQMWPLGNLRLLRPAVRDECRGGEDQDMFELNGVRAGTDFTDLRGEFR